MFLLILSHADGKEKKKGDHILTKGVAGKLESGFDKYLLRLFNEVRYWLKFQSEHPVPYHANEMYLSEKSLRILRESVMLVVREYNMIIDALSPEEMGLFAEHVRQIDRELKPGLTKLTWGAPSVKDGFVATCRSTCQSVYGIVMAFKENNKRIIRNCLAIENCALMDIESNYVYPYKLFEQRQTEHQEKAQKTLIEAHADIVNTLKASYVFFESHPRDTQQEWNRFAYMSLLSLVAVWFDVIARIWGRCEASILYVALMLS
jgi:dynein heavy chain